MIVSKANLSPVDVIKLDKKLPVLDNVYIGKDGTTVAGNGKAFIAVSPVVSETRKKLQPLMGDTTLDRDIVVTAETIKEVLKNMPRDRQFGGALEHVDVSGEEGSVRFALHDGKRKRSIDGKAYPYDYAPFRKVFARARKNKIAVRYVLNAKRLLPMLETLCKVLDDSSDYSPLFFEFSSDGDVMIRGQSPITGQRAVGIVWAYKGNEATWLELNEWERELADDGSNVDSDSNMGAGVSGDVDTNTKDTGREETPRPKRKAKRRGNKSLAHIVPGSKCPECGNYHLATDGKVKWCSGMDCTYYDGGSK